MGQLSNCQETEGIRLPSGKQLDGMKNLSVNRLYGNQGRRSDVACRIQSESL